MQKYVKSDKIEVRGLSFTLAQIVNLYSMVQVLNFWSQTNILFWRLVHPRAYILPLASTGTSEKEATSGIASLSYQLPSDVSNKKHCSVRLLSTTPPNTQI